MPESMFGRPMQHLLPSNTPTSTSESHTAPVRAATPTFRDFRFNSIGKQPELLSRISFPQQDHTDYHSPTPSPASTPPPPSIAFHSSRPTLLQQLGGSNFDSTDGRPRLTSQLGGSLASRIQMNDSANTSHGMPSEFLSLPLLVTSTARPVTKDASLIPPVEVLPQPPDSSPPTPASQVPPPQQVDIHSPPSSLMNTMTIETSQTPTPTAITNAVASEPAAYSPTLTLAYPAMQDLQPSPSTTTSIDSLVARQEHLHSISAKLTNLVSPLAHPSSQSPPLDPSSISRATTSQSQHNSASMVLHHPYAANQSSGIVGLSINDIPTTTDDSSLALVPSPTTVAREHQTQNRVIFEAIQHLTSALDAAHRTQMDNARALELRMQVFDEQRATFEQVKRIDEAALQQEFQELQQKREELNAKEASLVSLEKESKAREEARKGLLAKRQAQEEEKRVAEAKRVQEVQEQIEDAMKELKEIEVLKAKYQAEQLAPENAQNDLPAEPMDGMDEEEVVVIKSRNDLLCAVKHLRRMLTDKVQKLEDSGHTLRKLEEQRKHKEAEEAERHRIVEEERLQAHAEMDRARQVEEERRRQLELEKRRQEVEKRREQAQLLAEQQAHAETQIHAKAAPVGRTRRPEEATASLLQGTTKNTRADAGGEPNLPGTVNAMDVDDTFTPRLTVPPLPDAHTGPRTSKSAAPQSKQKKDKPTSGGVMLTAPAPKPNSGRAPSKTSAVAPSRSSSNHAAESASNLVRTTPAIPVSAENGPRSSIPAQVVSRHRRADTTPDRKPAFSRTPKSQFVLDAVRGEVQELNIGPLSGVSPTQQNVNLRHLKRFRGHAEGNDNGDRSVRTVNLKSEEISLILPKKEEQDDQSRELVQGPPSNNLPLPPRSGVIAPPRASRKRLYEGPASQTDPSNSRPMESSSFAPMRESIEQLRDATPSDFPSSHTTAASVQLPALPDATASLLLAPEPQATESRINAAERPTQNRSENNNTNFEPAVTYELDGEDVSRGNRRLPDEPRKARNANDPRRIPDHYSPPSQPTVTSPTQTHRLIDSWRPQNPSNGPRAELMRAASPTTGRKRPSEFNDNEHGHRARRQRSDVWIAQDHDRDRVDSYRPQWRLDTKPDERRARYRSPTPPPDRVWAYPLDASRTYDNRTFVPPASEELTAIPAGWESPPFRRTENGDTYQRYQTSAPGYNAMPDHHTDDARVGQTYEPMMEERMDVRPDPSLLARMHDTQRFPPRGRGRGEPSRGRGDFGRGRGRGAARSGPALIDRLTSGPSSLEDRLM